MPRFFFNLHDVDAAIDEEGCELDDLDSARVTVTEFLGATIKDSGLELFGESGWRLEVTDERGLILFAIYVVAQDAPVISATARKAPMPSTG